MELKISEKNGMIKGDIQILRQQLAERDALLREVCKRPWPYDVQGKIKDYLAAQSNGAKPAPAAPAAEPAPSDDLTASRCACGDEYPAKSYGAGFMAANNGVCENCDAANSCSPSLPSAGVEGAVAYLIECEWVESQTSAHKPGVQWIDNWATYRGIHEKASYRPRSCKSKDGIRNLRVTPLVAALPGGVRVPFLTADEREDLFEFYEAVCCDAGHRVEKAGMRRLAEIGAVESVGFGRHRLTEFGKALIAAPAEQGGGV